MIDFIVRWWRSLQLILAVNQGNTRLAKQLLQDIQKSGVELSWLEKLYRDKLLYEYSLEQSRKEVKKLSDRLQYTLQQVSKLESKNDVSEQYENLLVPDENFINFIDKSFKLVDHDKSMLQVTGIEKGIFDDFESNLFEYLKEEFSKYSSEELLIKLEDANEDINKLKFGQDPKYNLSLTPHLYFMKYFLENVYCNYLAWFLIYEQGLLSTKINVLDIAAGSGTVAYGLALLLKSISGFFPIPQMHVSYYSLEKQASFQYRGLQFWRRYIEQEQTNINVYFRFDTSDIITWDVKSSKIPKDFFDFIVISHCFFSDQVTRIQANETYKQIFDNNLKYQGHVLLIIQDKKLFKSFNLHKDEDSDQEENLIEKFVSEFNLDLVWYKYLTSVDSRTHYSAADFAKFARESLPRQQYISKLLQQYLGQKYVSHYALDDYIILAKKRINDYDDLFLEGY